jgi:hypothetical protein
MRMLVAMHQQQLPDGARPEDATSDTLMPCVRASGEPLLRARLLAVPAPRAMCGEKHQAAVAAPPPNTHTTHTGLLTALPAAMARATAVLVEPGSTARTTWPFSQYIAFLMAAWSDLLRTLPSGAVLSLDSRNDELAPLMLPGARLAAAALSIYAGGLQGELAERGRGQLCHRLWHSLPGA